MDEATQPKEKFNYFQRILVLLAGHVYDILDLNNIGSWNPESKSNSFSLGSYTKRRRTLKRTASQISFDRETLAIMVNKLCSFTSIQHLHINFADHYSEVFRKIAEKKPQFFRNLYLSFSGKIGDSIQLFGKQGCHFLWEDRGLKQLRREIRGINLSKVGSIVFSLLITFLIQLFATWLRDFYWEHRKVIWIAVKKDRTSLFYYMPSSLVQIIFEYAGISSKVGTFRVTVPTVYRIICQKLNSDLFNYFQSIQRLQSMKLYKLNNRNESWWDFQRSTHLSLSLNSLAASFLRYGQVEEGSNVLIATFIETIIRRIYIDAHNMLGRRSKIDVPAILMALRSSSGLSKIFRDFTLIEYLEWLNDYEEIPIDYISKLRPQSLTYNQMKILNEENYYRKLFLQEPNKIEPFALLINVYQNANSFIFQNLDEEEQNMPMLLNKFPIDKSKFNSPSIVSETQFWKNWDEFTQGKFKNLNWNNLFCAGGSILGCVDMSGMKGSDIDLFIYGCSVEEANNKVTYLVEYFKQIHENGILLQTKNSISLIFSYPTRNVQIILRLYHSPAEILLGFDIDSCAIGFDGKNVWTMERCIRALNKRYNLVNPSRRSTTYEYRLYKYSKRGFSVCVPSLNGSRVNINLFSKSIWQVQGLAKLLLYHRGFFSHQFLLGRKYLQRQTNSEREAIEETFIKRKGNFGIHDSEEDYSEFSLPYGPSWTNLSSYTKFLNSAKYANSSEALRRKIKFGDLNGLQIEQIEWLQQNPGQQNFIDENELLTGSFHPLSSKLWEQDVY